MRSPFPLPTPRPSGHAAVLRCDGRECADRVRDSGVSRRGGYADLLGGGREGGPLAGLFPGNWIG